MARDAAASGDRVIAENYLQHAEHYNRIIAAATAASNRNEENAGTGKGPQPDVQPGERPRADGEDGAQDNADRREKETQVTEQAAQGGTQPAGAGAVNAPEGGERPKREPRGKRRARKADDGSHGSGNGANGADGDDQKPEMTEDASKLPGNLIGMPDDGNAETGASKDD